MPRHPHRSKWCLQQEQFAKLAADDNAAAWYWEIRLKIVQFLISRYGEQPGPVSSGPVPHRYPATRLPRRQDIEIDRQLKSPERIRLLLANIRHEVASARQFENE